MIVKDLAKAIEHLRFTAWRAAALRYQGEGRPNGTRATKKDRRRYQEILAEEMEKRQAQIDALMRKLKRHREDFCCHKNTHLRMKGGDSDEIFEAVGLSDAQR